VAHGGTLLPGRTSMRQREAQDTRAEYRAIDTTILAQAEAILRRRLERLGAITDPTQASDFFRMRLAGLEHEQFHVMYLDTRHHIIAVDPMARGTIDGAEVHPARSSRQPWRTMPPP